MQGVYCITCTGNGRTYVGSARDVERRWNEHVAALTRKRHENKYLQNAFNKYGVGAFRLSVLEVVSEESELIAREQWWIDN